jgi:glyoxylase I family protein
MMQPIELTRRGAAGLALGAAAAAHTSAAGVAQGAEKTMERVDGIGGFFFRSENPRALTKWYQDNLGITPVPHGPADQPWRTGAGVTAFAPFPKDTKMFGKPSQQWMINFRVPDIEKMAAQLRANGVTVEVDPEHYPIGRFASLNDPEGNPIQLWQPQDKRLG